MKRYSPWLKGVAFVLASVCAAGMLVAVFRIDRGGSSGGSYNNYRQFPHNDYMQAATYFDTSVHQRKVEIALDNVEKIAELLTMLESGNYAGVAYSYDYVYYGKAADSGTQYSGYDAIVRHIVADLEYLNSVRELIYFVQPIGSNTIYHNIQDVENLSYDSILNMPYSASRSANGVIAFDGEYIADRVGQFTREQFQFQQSYKLLWLSLAVEVIVFAYLVFAVGRRNQDKKIRLIFIDNLPTELTIAGILMLLSVGVISNVGWFGYSYNFSRYDIELFVVSTLTAAIGLTLVLSIVRRIKDRTILRNAMLHSVYKFAKMFYNSRSMQRRVMVAVAAIGLATAILGIIFGVGIGWRDGAPVIVGLLGVILLLVAAMRLTARTLQRLTRVSEDALNEEVNRRFRAERMRTELISNVSHDIRTPLTSVITYVDLLKKESIENEKARGYIDVIDSKAQRLKVLTDDLFEASKAASGNVPVTLDDVDLNALIAQGLGEMDAKIQSSGLDFRITLADNEVIAADGKLLWRVVENLLSNVFKYAMPASRVYIETSGDESYASLTIKNISENALNIPAEELMERFKRGDEARSGEGSGLGLSIAKSLTEAMGGRFEIAVDGDLFKAEVILPRA